MHIDKLQEIYLDLKKKHEENPDINFKELLWEEYDKNIELIPIPSSEKLAIVRTVLDGCTRKIGLYEYMDGGLAKITMDIIVISKLTDIDFGGGEDDASDDAPSSLKYDKIYLLGLKDYLRDRIESELLEFEDFEMMERATIEARNAPGAIMERQRLIAKEGKEGGNEGK